MSGKKGTVGGVVGGVIAILVALAVHCSAEPPNLDPVKGAIDFISPVTDAESGTVRVKVRIDNPQNKYRSGQRCALQL